MSFVGPRPLRPIDQPIGFSSRQLVRPGLTGWAQIMGGRHVGAKDKVALDLWNLRNASLALHLRIVVRTAPMLINGEQVNAASIDTAWSELAASSVCGQELRSQPATSVASDDVAAPGRMKSCPVVTRASHKAACDQFDVDVLTSLMHGFER